MKNKPYLNTSKKKKKNKHKNGKVHIFRFRWSDQYAK